MDHNHYAQNGPGRPIEESRIDPSDPSVEAIVMGEYSFADALDYCDIEALAANLEEWAGWLEDHDIDPSTPFEIDGVEA